MKEKKELTIEDLLNSLQNPDNVITDLPNNAVTWNRIANKDAFEELELDSSELDDFLKRWVEENPYSNLV